MRRLPPTSPEVEDYVYKCFASVCFLSVHARVLFLHKLNVMGGSLLSPEVKVSCRARRCFCFAHIKRTRYLRMLFIFHINFHDGSLQGGNLNAAIDKWMALCHETVSIDAHTLVKRFYSKNAEKMFHYCSGIFIILFLRGHNFFLPFRLVSLPQFTFSLLPLLQSSAGSALFSPQEFYDSLTECWDTKHLSSAGKGETGLTNRDTKP